MSVEYGSPENLPFEAPIEAMAVGSVVLGRMSGTIKHATRKASNIANDDSDGYLLLINKADTVLSGVEVGREYAVGQGEAVLVTASEALKMTCAGSNVWTNVAVPRAILLRAFPQIDDRLGLKIGADSEALDLLKRYCLLLESGSPLGSADLITHATDTIVDLIGLATGAKGRAAELAGLRGLRAARLEAVLARIAEDFIDPGISAQSVAQQLGLSVRYVHDLLQETGMSFSERVLELRLQSAHRMLSHLHSDMRVSDIALTSGFSDVSYFNRCFRRRFGYTPTSAR
ncbi:AraC family transcriptional regulator [Mesorhizobium sp. SARCC-RB16n]|uniref:AraC family transcriptional regulator n=1 Tax=Mesorhizobium sp. SARCC-RB16n TaxID=2116687 RepID=UPI001FEF3054|nr:AraC family transcriptional regulator [Mesorhizobium sp. SARCC-RB16n]